MGTDYENWVESDRKMGRYSMLFLFIVCLFVLFFCAKQTYFQVITDWNCVDHEDIYFNKKDSSWHLKSNDALFDGILCKFHGDSRYVAGKKEGPHTHYYQGEDYNNSLKQFFKQQFLFSDTKRRTMNYSNGQLNGSWEEYDLDGNVIQYSNYSNGKLHGESGVFENGQWKKEKYLNGVLVNNISDEVKKDTQENIEKLDDAVVLIEIYDYFGDYLGHGSGFIIDKYGTVVTNYHVVDGAYRMKVVIEKNGFKTKYDVQKIISGSKSKDLAKIAIKRNNSEFFSYLNLAKNHPTKGDDCWSISTPFEPDYMNTVSKGLISNLQSDRYSKKIQHTAETTRGSSGGALLNSLSEVIGVVSGGIETLEGYRASLNFAISIGELNNLPSINKKNIVDPNSIPCKIAFYTDDKTAGDLSLSIDGIYLGSFTSYLTNQPSCGDPGTLTKVLYSGSHNYEIYNKTTGKTTYDRIFLEPGDCRTIRVWH
ncbi:trypsin-like peptidase domain-containing protein [Crocinitomicaceae bacterium]|nr:trypsin-like peptidase domain-containing protein [Crocinitomicaceae bacterium]